MNFKSRMFRLSLAVSGLCALGFGLAQWRAPQHRSVDEAYSKTIETLGGYLDRTYGDKRAFMRRDAHTKGHACLRGDLNYANASGPAPFDGSVKSTPVVMRFSNGQIFLQPDSEPDGRGAALKIFINGEAGPTLDFVMIGASRFFLRNSTDVYYFYDVLLSQGMWRYFTPDLWNPFTWRWRAMAIAAEIGGNKIGSVFQPNYYTMSAYRLGDLDAKIRISPCETQVFGASNSSADYLREDALARASASQQCFRLQMQARPAGVDADDASAIWDEKMSPYRDLGRIEFPPQDAKTHDSYCEGASFSPDHATTAIQPIGSLNAVRRKVYETQAAKRRNYNEALTK